MMKICLSTILLFTYSLVFSEDSISSKPNKRISFEASILYSPYNGSRTVEIYPGPSSDLYQRIKFEDTFGFSAGVKLMNPLSSRLFVWHGLSVANTNSARNVEDTLSNYNSMISFHASRYSLNYPLLIGTTFKRFGLSIGLTVPIIELTTRKEKYENGSKNKLPTTVNWGEFYISARTSYDFGADNKFAAYLQADVNPDIFKRGNRGYNQNYSLGIIYLVSRQRKSSSDDYVK